MALRWARLVRDRKSKGRQGGKFCEDFKVVHCPPKVSAINRLPVEILSIIFSYEDDPAWRSPGLHFALRHEAVLSQVCRLWRTITLNMPFLWNRIALVHYDEHIVAQTYALLKRSKRVPLEIRVDWRPLWDLRHADYAATYEGPVDYRREALRDALSALTRHVARWRLLLIRVDNQEVMQDALSAIASCSSAPLLEHLCLAAPTCNEEGREVPFDYSSALFSCSMPSLTYLSLRNSPSHWCGASTTGSLTVLKLHLPYDIPSASYGDFMDMLARSPSLQVFWLSCVHTFEGYEDWVGDRVLLPELEKLSFHNIGPDLGSKLLACLAITNLKRLELNLPDCWGSYESFVQELVTPYPETGQTILHSVAGLRVESIACQVDILSSMLYCLPKLSVLFIDHCHSSIFYLVLMRYMAQSIAEYSEPQDEYTPLLLPLLDTVVLGDSDALVVRCLVEWRLMVDRRLRRLFVDSKMIMDIEEEDRLVEQLDVFGRVLTSPSKELLLDLDEVMDSLITAPKECVHVIPAANEQPPNTIALCR
ncbi:hypothetical protein DENSPDRAFT_885676 [Dentipellis sp. KUC8613]|nr:hypothetical protein DENSPDRAFT_885676 [Dentipellis sp. KUC8613]